MGSELTWLRHVSKRMGQAYKLGPEPSLMRLKRCLIPLAGASRKLFDMNGEGAKDLLVGVTGEADEDF